jgi:MFS family permease
MHHLQTEQSRMLIRALHFLLELQGAGCKSPANYEIRSHRVSTDTLPVTTDGRLITDRVLYRGLRINIIAGALGTAWWALTQGMPLTMFMEALGSKGVLIGAAMTVMQLALVMQVPAAFYASRLPTRKRLWAITILVSRMIWFLPAVCLLLWPNRPLTVASATVWIAAVSAILGQGVSALWYSWMADLVPDNMRGRFWGVRQSWTTIAFVAAMAVAGYILDVFPSPHGGTGSWSGFILVFILGGAVGSIDIIVHLWVPEPRVHVQAETTNWLERIVEPMRQADFRRLTIAMAIHAFSTTLVSLGIVYLKKDFHVTYSHLSAITIASSLGTVLSGFMWGYIMDRIGGRGFAAAMFAVMPLPAIAWFFVKDYNTDITGLFEGIRGIGPAVTAFTSLLPTFWVEWIHGQVLPQPIWILLFTSFIAGAIFGGVGLCQLNMIGSLSPTKSRTMAMAVHWTVVGVVGSLGALIAGKAMDYFAEHPANYIFPTGTRFAFHHAMIIAHVLITWFVILPIMLRIRRRKNEPHFALAITQLFVNNPLRAFASIYMMAAPVTGKQRARAVRSLGSRRTSYAVSDLVQRLDDPSRDVREEAAAALGNIGSPEAVAALVARLQIRNHDLAPQIARALRTTKDRAAVDALMARLHDPDTETVIECARALGEIGDPRAGADLLALVSKSSDIGVIAAAAEALARLNEVTAVYRIVPRMIETPHLVLKRSLAVAVGDLIDVRDEFYKALTKEQHSRGSQTTRLLRHLRREIKRATRKNHRADRAQLIEKTEKAEWSLEKGDTDACAALLFDLSLDIAALMWSVRRDNELQAVLDEVSGHDQTFAAGIWYLDQLRRKWIVNNVDSRDHFDILLGVFFLASRRLRE